MTIIKRKPKNSLSNKPLTVKVRRFEPGASSLFCFGFLESCGYAVYKKSLNLYGLRYGKVGRYKTVSEKELIELVDKLRKKRGLEPFRKVEK